MKRILFSTAMVIHVAINAWQLGPFERADQVNPILAPVGDTEFLCPVQKKKVFWQKDHTFNPAACVREGKVYILYRSEDDFGQGIGGHTSRLGIAVSSDGLHFKRSAVPVMFPANDDQYLHEWPGGCEDPRIVETEEGGYVMTYTQWNQKIAVLSVATSKNLMHWKKHGYVFEHASKGDFGRIYCKSGSIVCRVENDRLIATKIHGKYWMYWGEGLIHAATSNDLISWEPILEGNLPKTLVGPRKGFFDSMLVEAGPPAILTNEGIVLLYNGKNSPNEGDPDIPRGAYCAGQLLFDAQHPTKVLARSEKCFLKPEKSFETKGQYEEGTVFVQGLVHFQGKWFLYYGAADSFVGVAISQTKTSNGGIL